MIFDIGEFWKGDLKMYEILTFENLKLNRFLFFDYSKQFYNYLSKSYVSNFELKRTLKIIRKNSTNFGILNNDFCNSRFEFLLLYK